MDTVEDIKYPTEYKEIMLERVLKLYVSQEVVRDNTLISPRILNSGGS